MVVGDRRAFVAAALAAPLLACDRRGSAAAAPAYTPIDRRPLDSRVLQAERRVLQAVAARTAQARPVAGAAADGRSDDLAALQRAVAAGPVDGHGRTFAIDGTLRLGAGAVLSNLVIRQLDPQRHRFVVYGERGEIVLDRVTVERGGDGRQGDQAETAAVRLDRARLTLNRCRVCGDGQGAGWKLVSCAGDAVDLSVGDSIARPRFASTDDLQDGIWLVACEGFNLVRPAVSRLLTEVNGEALPIWSRGVTVSGGRGGLIHDYRGQDVDQHIDLTGDMNPREWTVYKGRAERGRYHGVKCANTAVDIAVLDVTVEAVNRAAFVCSSPGPEFTDAARVTQRVVYENCLARNTGVEAERYLVRGATGFKVETNRRWRDYPKGVVWWRCRAEGGGHADYGWDNDVPGNRAIECASTGSRVREFEGV